MADLHFEKGKICRLAWSVPISKGKWYVGVTCKGCKNPILILDDPSKGGTPPSIKGEGLFSIVCHDCGTDTFYGTDEWKQFRATEDRPHFQHKRPEPSGRPRQPFLPKHEGNKPTFGIGALEQRPEAAQVIARCIAYWTDVEAQTARLLATILKANTEPAIALYLSLQNARAKADAMNAAAEATLTDDDQDLFHALLAYKRSVEKERTALAHGIFGISASIPSGVVWLSTTHYAQYQANVSLHGVTDALYREHLENCFVYELGDLETIAREIENLHRVIGWIAGYFSSNDESWRATRYRQLCSEPRLSKELERLRKDRKSEPAAQTE